MAPKRKAAAAAAAPSPSKRPSRSAEAKGVKKEEAPAPAAAPKAAAAKKGGRAKKEAPSEVDPKKFVEWLFETCKVLVTVCETVQVEVQHGRGSRSREVLTHTSRAPVASTGRLGSLNLSRRRPAHRHARAVHHPPIQPMQNGPREVWPTQRP